MVVIEMINFKEEMIMKEINIKEEKIIIDKIISIKEDKVIIDKIIIRIENNIIDMNKRVIIIDQDIKNN